MPGRSHRTDDAWIWGGLLGIGVLLLWKSSSTEDHAVAGKRLVFKRERAAGVDRRLQAFLDWWEKNGAFPIVVDPKGGVRRDEAEQAMLFATGKTNARTLAETPHGRGGALDLYPVLRSAGPYVLQIETSASSPKFTAIGVAAENFGLKWGGRWRTAKFPDGDKPHIEVPDWKTLPYPPPLAS